MIKFYHPPIINPNIPIPQTKQIVYKNLNPNFITYSMDLSLIMHNIINHINHNSQRSFYLFYQNNPDSMGQSEFNICKTTEQQPDIDSKIEQGLNIVDQQRVHQNYLSLDGVQNQPEYNFQYVQDHPQTLTMTRRCKDIVALMYSVPTYIWIDPNMHQNISDIKFIQQQIKCTLVYVKHVEDAEQLLGMAKNYMVICSLKIAEQVQSNLSSHSTVKGIVCYCKDTATYLNLKQHNKLGKKFMFCTDKLTQLVKHLKQNRHYTYCYKEHPNFISMRDQAWNSNTLIQTIMSMLVVKTNRLQLIEQLCKLARMIGTKQQVEQFHERAIVKQFQGQQAIRWYTRDTFLYALINTLLRSSRHPCQMYVMQPFVKDLFNGIKQMHREQANIQKYNNFTCYRGGMISQAQVQYYQKNTGMVVQSLGFLSATISQDIAKNFLRKRYNNAIFHIKVNKIKQQVYDQGYAWIGQFSDQTNQQQILFNPLSSFRIAGLKNSIEKGKDYYMIQLQYGILSKIMQIQQEKLSNVERNSRYLAQYQRAQTQMVDRFGDILQYRVKQNNEFFDKYTQKAISLMSNEQGHNIYHLYHLGNVQFRGRKYNSAITYYNQCQQSYKSKYKHGGHMHRQIWQKIAECYANTNDHERAVEIYEKILHYLNDEQRTTQIQISRAKMFEKVGDAWVMLKQQIKGIACLRQCMQIQSMVYGQYSMMHANTLASIGMAYMESIQHPDSKDYFLEKAQQALKQSETIVRVLQGQENMGYIRAINALAVVHTRRNEYSSANELLTKVQNVYGKLKIQNSDLQFAYLINFGTNYAGWGDNAKAVLYLDRALEVVRLNSAELHQSQDTYYQQIACVRDTITQRMGKNGH